MLTIPFKTGSEATWGDSGLDSFYIPSATKAHLTFALGRAFGSSVDQKNMDISLLRSGNHGLPRFYDSIVCWVLDEEDTSTPLYADHISVLKACCEALAAKMRNFSKVCHFQHRVLG
jgi:hypothetical protein